MNAMPINLARQLVADRQASYEGIAARGRLRLSLRRAAKHAPIETPHVTLHTTTRAAVTPAVTPGVAPAPTAALDEAAAVRKVA